jgi:NTP pyrophosphatase (non-canonical NTP hydrolase)
MSERISKPPKPTLFGYNSTTMDLKDLTEQMQALVAAKGWGQQASSKPQTPRNLAISLVLEASEVLELFQWQDQPADQDALAGELADTMLYLLQLASISGIDLEQAVLSKIAQNHQRQWPEHHSGEAQS